MASLNLTREAVLADRWEMSIEQFRLLRRRHRWSHVEFSRQDIRYTDEQIDQIVRDMTTRSVETKAEKASPLTSRSAARAAS